MRTFGAYHLLKLQTTHGERNAAGQTRRQSHDQIVTDPLKHIAFKTGIREHIRVVRIAHFIRKGRVAQNPLFQFETHHKAVKTAGYDGEQEPNNPLAEELYTRAVKRQPSSV